MAFVRLESSYWRMVHHGIELAIKEEKRKSDQLKIASVRRNISSEEKRELERKIWSIDRSIQIYEAIDDRILKASKKHDIYHAGIGPEASHSCPEQDEDEKMRWLEQID